MERTGDDQDYDDRQSRRCDMQTIPFIAVSEDHGSARHVSGLNEHRGFSRVSGCSGM